MSKSCSTPLARTGSDRGGRTLKASSSPLSASRGERATRQNASGLSLDVRGADRGETLADVSPAAFGWPNGTDE
jgi:hypothetical protein